MLTQRIDRALLELGFPQSWFSERRSCLILGDKRFHWSGGLMQRCPSWPPGGLTSGPKDKSASAKPPCTKQPRTKLHSLAVKAFYLLRTSKFNTTGLLQIHSFSITQVGVGCSFGVGDFWLSIIRSTPTHYIQIREHVLMSALALIALNWVLCQLQLTLHQLAWVVSQNRLLYMTRQVYALWVTHWTWTAMSRFYLKKSTII